MHIVAVFVVVCTEMATAAMALLQEYSSLKVRLSKIYGTLLNLKMARH